MLRILAARSLALFILAFGHSGFAQQGAPNGEWPAYGGDLGHSKYSPLDQIDAAQCAALADGMDLDLGG